MTVRILQGHVLDVLASLPAKSAHVCVTSPPYWQLRAYGTPPQAWGDGWVGELGQEPGISGYLAHLVEVFGAVRRVLRDDGTLWVNLSDSYWNNPGGQNGAGGMVSEKAKDARRAQGRVNRMGADDGPRAGDLCMIPARFALAMQAAGWTLRSEITLCKTAPMPESVQGARWERCRVSVRRGIYAEAGHGVANPTHGASRAAGNFRNETEATRATNAEWADCPGCPKCAATEGYVQRWGSGRPTSATEKLFLFSKAGARYFWDAEAVRVKLAVPDRTGTNPIHGELTWGRGRDANRPEHDIESNPSGRNLWNYVMWAPEPLKEGHYAAFPRWLPRLAIRAGTSERGVCPGCGAPWLRVVERGTMPAPRKQGAGTYEGMNRENDRWPSGTPVNSGLQRDEWNTGTTVGWRPSCACPPAEPAPAVCLDPFAGSGTTLIEANALGRHGWGIELQQKYVEIAHRRLSRQPVSLFAHEGAEAFVGGDVEPLGTTKQEQHPNRTVAGFNQRWKAKQAGLLDAAGG